MIGPDLPSGVRRPGRAVSLPSPELQRMGFDFDEFDAEIAAALEGESAAVDPFAASVERMLEGGVAPASSYEAAGAYNITEEDYEAAGTYNITEELRRVIREEIDGLMTDVVTLGGRVLVEFDPRVMEYLANPSVAQEVVAEIVNRVAVHGVPIPSVDGTELDELVARELDGFLARGGYADRFHPVREYLESIGAPLGRDAVTGEPIQVVGLDPAADPAGRDLAGLTDRQLETEIEDLRSDLGAASMQEGIEAASQRPGLARLEALIGEWGRREDHPMQGLSSADRALLEGPQGVPISPSPVPGLSGVPAAGPRLPGLSGVPATPPIRPQIESFPIPAMQGPQIHTAGQGLTADEAFQQHQATSGAGAMGGMNAMASSSVNPVWVYGGHGNPPQQQVGRDSWTGEGYGELADAVGKTDPSINPDDPNEVLDWLGKGVPVGQEEGATAWEIQPDGTVVEVPVPDPADWVPGEVVEPDEVPNAPPATGGSLLAQGLTADQAFQMHHAMSGRVDPNQGELPGTGGPREQLEETRRKVPRRTREEQAAYEKALRERGRGGPAPVVPPPVPPPVSPMEDRNPELRSMDSQMLTDMMAAQVTQPDQGYFGGMGEAIQGLTNRVAGMSNMERAALISALVAAGLITMGSGGMLAPAGAALVGGAGMAALNQ